MACLLVAALALGGPASAQRPPAEPSGTPGSAGVDLDVLVLEAVPDDERPLRLELALRNRRAQTLEGIRVVTTVHRRVSGRAALAEALAGDPAGVWNAGVREERPLPAGATRLVQIVAEPEDLDLVDPERHSGVYPLSVQVFADSTAVAELRTVLVYLPEPEVRLWSTLLVGIDGVAPRGPDGRLTPDGRNVFAAGSRLDRLTRPLEQAVSAVGGAGITIAAEALLLEDAADLADGTRLADGRTIAPTDRAARQAAAILERLRATVRRANVTAVTYPYADADVAALIAGGQEDTALRLVAQAPAALADVLGVPVRDDILAGPAEVDEPAMALAVTAGVRHLVVPPPPAPGGRSFQLVTAPPVMPVDPRESDLAALVADAAIAALLRDVAPGDEAAVVQRVLAETALIHGELPGRLGRGVLVHAGAGWDPTPELLAGLVRGLDGARWLRPVSLETLARVVVPGPTLRAAVPPAGEDLGGLPGDYVAALTRARESLPPIAAVLPAGDSFPAEVSDQLDRVSSVHHAREDLQEIGRAVAARAVERLAGLTAAVDLPPSPQITLTGDTGEVPVTVANVGAAPLEVLVQVVSGSYAFEEPQRLVTLAPESQVVLTFPARALSPGLQSVVVTVTDPMGSVVLATQTIAVRSTAIPFAALIVTIGAAGFLAVWWGTEVVRGRRQDRPDDDRIAA